MKTSTLLAGVLTVTIGGGFALMGGSVLRGEPDSSPITRVDLAQSATDNAYDAVSQLRPNWLIPDSTGGGGDLPTVYVEIRCTEIDCLRWLRSDQIEEARYLGPDFTRGAWPPSNQGRAIVVTLRTRDLGGDPGAVSRGGSW